jgi:methylsterol monooxygenase
MMCVEDFWMYWCHRFMHMKNFFGINVYKYLHKEHHNFNMTTSIVALYNSPAEYFMMAWIPPYIPILFILGDRLHIVTFLMYNLVRIFVAHEIHCGYDFPWSVWRFVPF